VRTLLRIVAVAAGALLLAFIAPHTNPWTMCLLPVHASSVSLDLAGRTFEIPLWLVWVSAALVVLVPWVVNRRRSGNRQAALDSATDRNLFAACVVLLIASMIPAAARGRGTVTYLLLGTAGLVLLACGLTPSAAVRFDAWRRSAVARLQALPAPVLVPAACLVVVVVAGLGSLFALGQMPHVVDSAAQGFHARIFLAGELTAPLPEPEAAFQFTHMVQDGRWYSQYPPGHSLMLALGLLLHATWLIGPLLGGLSVALLYFAGRDAYDEPTGRWALLIGMISPFVWIMSSSQMSHTTTLFFVCLFLFGFVQMMNTGKSWAALLTGFAIGCALNARPLTAIAFAVPFSLYAGAELVRRLSRPAERVPALRLARNCLLATASFAVPLCALLAFNKLTNGDPFVFGYEALHGKQALLGFGKTGWWGQPHTPLRGLTATLNNLNALNQYLLGLPFPALALPLLGFAVLRRTRWDWMLVASASGLVVAHFFYWYQDLTYGPRFLYAAVAPLVLLSARSLMALPALFERMLPGRCPSGTVGVAFALALLYGWTVSVPQMAGFYSRNYYGANPDVPRAVVEAQLTDAVVLAPDHYYTSLFPLNRPALDGNVIHARDLGPVRNRKLAEAFPARTLYRLRSHDRYRLMPYDAGRDSGVVAYALESGSPFELELLSFQLSHLANGSGRDHWTGELGPLFRNHDQLWISSATAGLEAGLILDAEQDETRSLELQVMRSPDSGILEIRMNGSLLQPGIDLYARRVGVERLTLDRVALHAGRNGLLLRIVDKNLHSRGFGLGLDYLRLE